MAREVHITGMHCEGCADSLERYLRSEPGVTRATVCYETGRATVATDEETALGPLLTAIEEMGYGAEVVERS